MKASRRLSERLKLETLTPVHIGNGEKLYEMDYIFKGGEILVLDIPRLAADFPRVMVRLEAGHTGSLADLAVTHGLTLARLPRLDAYVLWRVKARRPVRGEIKTHIRDGLFKAYIPGSSIKGAIRTALLWRELQANGAQYVSIVKDHINKIKERRIPASKKGKERVLSDITQALENAVFRGGSNDVSRDLLRCLWVSDAYPEGEITTEIHEFVRVYRGGKKRLPTYHECIPPGTTLAFDLAIDHGILSSHRAPESIREALKSPEALLRAVGEFYRRVLTKIRGHFGILWSPDSQGWLVSLGFGGGWTAKTVGEWLREENEELFGELYRLFTHKNKPQNPRDFPLTKVMVGNVMPGWVEIT